MADSGSEQQSSSSAGDVGPPLVSSTTPAKATTTTDEKERRVSRVQPPSADSKQSPQRKRSSYMLSGDALLQLQMKAKANKEERRQTLDERHQYMFDQLSDAIDVERSVVEDYVLCDERFNTIENFFAINGSRKLMFFYQQKDPTSLSSNTKLFITDGNMEAVCGRCLFFIRTNVERPVTVSNISSDVIFMSIDFTEGDLLRPFETILSKVLIPITKTQQEWGGEERSRGSDELIEQLANFTRDLSAVRQSLDVKKTLTAVDCCDQLDTLTTPSDYQTACKNPDLVRQVEELVVIWCREIEMVVLESEQIRREADDVGPGAELQYWINRRNKFNALVEQVKSPRCKAAIGILNAVKSKQLRKWRQLDACITDSANEAKDNVKFLRTLDSFFSPLEKADPVAMLELIPGLINTTSMIYGISSYYNTPERMTSLFVKITNQLIKTCKAYMRHGVGRVWEHEPTVLLSRIEHCANLNRTYQQHFHKRKEILKQKPQERQFEFSENSIFGKFDTFVRRLDKISKMARTMSDYSGLLELRVDNVDKIVVRYRNLVDTYKKKSYDVLDHRRQEFDFDYTEFCTQFELLHKQIQDAIDAWFTRHVTTEFALELLGKFEIVAALRPDIGDRYRGVLKLYGRELDQVRLVYQSDKSDPPVSRNLPPIAGRIAWARQLYRRIEGPIKILKNKVDLMKSEDGRRIVRNYNKLAAVLLEYEVLYHRGWCQAVDVAVTSLNSSLLIVNPVADMADVSPAVDTRRYIVNIDPHILELIQDAKYLQKMNLEIKDSANTLLMCEDKIRTTRELLASELREFERVWPTLRGVSGLYCGPTDNASTLN
jgi:dynein heavy chain